MTGPYRKHMRIQTGDRGSGPPPPHPRKIKKNIGLIHNTGPDLPKNHKATKPAFKVGPSSARQRNGIKMAFRWWADDGPFKVIFGSSSTKNNIIKVGPTQTKNFLDPRMQVRIENFFWFFFQDTM